MKVTKSVAFFVVVVFLSLSVVCTSDSIILQPRGSNNKKARSSSGVSWRRPNAAPPSKPECDVSQARYDTNCYAKLRNISLGCESDLGGVGSLDSICRIRSTVQLGAGSFMLVGSGTLEIEHDVTLSCSTPGCEIVFLLTGNLTLGAGAALQGGSLTIQVPRIEVGKGASISATARAGSPPAGTSGTPLSLEGAGGGHGGRGASCERDEMKDQGDVWGGDMYEWEHLVAPWSHGSRGGTTEDGQFELGGAGGGRIAITTGTLVLNGTIEANGGSVDFRGGGGSGGSIVIEAQIIEGSDGTISASGGTGRGGGGGGRVAIDYERMMGVEVYIYGGDSLGCPRNAGAAGTLFEVPSQSLVISNNFKESKTDTVLLAFSVPPLWGSVLIKESARIGVPLQWSTLRVCFNPNMSHQ